MSIFRQYVNKCFREKGTMVALFLVICLLFIATFFSQVYQETRIQQRIKTYGVHNGSIYGISEDAIQRIVTHRAVDVSGTMTIYGKITDVNGFEIGALGVVDPNFQKLENLTFLEGTYPKAEDEIAIEHFVLDQLNIPYQLGASITLRITLFDGETVQRNFQLCGILNTYSTNWKADGFPLSSALVLSSDLPIMQKHLFFYGQYENAEQMEELASLTTGRLVYNDYSYPRKAFSFSGLIADGLAVVICLAIGFLFLACIQISSHKKQLHRMRVLLLLGGERRKLFRALYLQLLYDWCIVYLLSIAFCTLFVFLFKQGIEQYFQYKLTLWPYFLSGILSLVTMLIGKSVQIALLTQISILPKGRDLGRYETNRKSKSHPLLQTEKDFVGIQTRRNIKQHCMEAGVIVLSSVILFFSLFGLCEEARVYQTENIINNYDYSWRSTLYNRGLPFSKILQVKNTANIDRVIYTVTTSTIADERIYVTYPNSQYDDYIPSFATAYDTLPLFGLPVHVVVIPEESALWDYYVHEDIDPAAFLSGETAILYLPDRTMTADGRYISINSFGINASSATENAIACDLDVGDLLEVNVGETNQTVTCAYVMKRFPQNQQTVLDFLSAGSILISENLYCTLTGLDTVQYNYVLAIGNDDLSYDTTDKIMSAISTASYIRFTNNRIERATAKQELLTNILSLGSVGAITCILSIIILYWNRQCFYAAEQGRVNLLKNIGADNALIRKIYCSKYIRYLAVCILLLNACTFLANGYRNYSPFVPEGELFATWSSICTYASNNFPWLVILTPQCAFLLVVNFITKRPPSCTKV